MMKERDMIPVNYLITMLRDAPDPRVVGQTHNFIIPPSRDVCWDLSEIAPMDEKVREIRFEAMMNAEGELVWMIDI